MQISNMLKTPNTISLSCNEQVNILVHDMINLNILVHDMINLLYYEY